MKVRLNLSIQKVQPLIAVCFQMRLIIGFAIAIIIVIIVVSIVKATHH